MEPTRKRIRATLGGVVVVDSIAVLLGWENDHYPQYYVPRSDVTAHLEPAGEWEPPGGSGVAQRYDVISTTGQRAEGAAWSYADHERLADHVRFEWDAFEAWFEEDETVHVHPRSPYVRVDALRSSRDIEVAVDGTVVAHSQRSVVLFETGLRPRYYLPPTDVRLDVLRDSATRTSCAYKGRARYLHVVVNDRMHDDLVWTYETPRAEALPVAGMLCFHDEHCHLFVDGVRQGSAGP